MPDMLRSYIKFSTRYGGKVPYIECLLSFAKNFSIDGLVFINIVFQGISLKW